VQSGQFGALSFDGAKYGNMVKKLGVIYLSAPVDIYH